MSYYVHTIFGEDEIASRYLPKEPVTWHFSYRTGILTLPRGRFRFTDSGNRCRHVVSIIAALSGKELMNLN